MPRKKKGSFKSGSRLGSHTEKFYNTWDFWGIMFILALLLRLLLTLIPPYRIDMSGYVAWSRGLAANGPIGFYEAFHVVYAPMFQYCLWLTGLVAEWLNLSFGAHVYAIKLWSVAADAVGAALLINFAAKKGAQKTGWVLGMLYFLNPAVIFNSSIWGQFDGIIATMLLGVILFYIDGKPVHAAVLYLASVLVKPQSGLLAPLALAAFIKALTVMPWKKILSTIALTFSIGVALYLVVVLPFYTPTSSAAVLPVWLDPFWWLLDLYLTSAQDYPYGSANAYNLWFLLGGQILPNTTVRLWISDATWGFALLAPFALWTLYLYLRKKPYPSVEASLIHASWIIVFAAFTIMTKMHERYLVTGLLLGAAGIIFEKKLLWPWLLASFISMVNHWVIYDMSLRDVFWLSQNDVFGMIASVFLVGTFIWTLVVVVQSTSKRQAIPTAFRRMCKRVK